LPDVGTVWVIEHQPSLPALQYESEQKAIASLSGTPDFHGTAQLVTIANGALALMETAPQGGPNGVFSSITWYEHSTPNDVEIRIMGPTLTVDQAVKIANMFK